jgi:predicted RNase H-like HicB family nuclease
MTYAVVIEPTDTGYSAYAPDLPGCVATGQTIEQVKARMREAIALHLAGFAEDGEPAPKPGTQVARLDPAA